MRLIYGADRADSGGIALGQPPQAVNIDSPKAAVRAGIALITEDRKGEGLLLTQSISANIALGNLGAVSRAGVLDSEAEKALAERQIQAMRIRSAGAQQVVGELSGGNQQKW